MRFNIIVAHSFPKYGIGINGKLPWNLPKDLTHFKNITTRITPDPTFQYINTVIMGSKTWASIPAKYRPLNDRLNIIITRSPKESDNPMLAYCKWEDLTNILLKFNKANHKSLDGKIYQIEKNFIIGGNSIYNYAIESLDVCDIYATEIYQTGVEYDTFFPKINYSETNTQFKLQNCGKFEREKVERGEFLYYRFMRYRHQKYMIEVPPDMIYQNKEEKAYLAIMKHTLENGIEREDRTGTGTISTFGNQLKYDLSETFPLSTTKRMFFRAIFEELMLYLRGQTDNKILNKKDIHIWDGNTTREFLDKRGLKEFREGDMGETYGFNFRHFGGEYKGCDAEYGPDCGFDQLTECIRLIKDDPTSRRIIITLWNPLGNLRAALPSCLCWYQFYVDTVRHKLNLQIYLRSSDYFLANNWNACTGALLVHMICNLEGVNLLPGELTMCIGDTHLYKTHIEQVRENLKREPYPYPMLRIRSRKDDITKFQFEDLNLIGYKAHPRISASMAV
jgi:dihydrofolate reductase/thymidylate synthase